MGQEIYLLALVLGLACGLGILLAKFKQPLLVAYILAGAILSAFNLIKPEQLDFLAILPEVGLAFLLFLVGMELDLREFRKLGKSVILITLGQVLTTSSIFWLVTRNGFFSIAMGLTSTILVVKILLEEKESSSLHGKLAIGSLLVEDLLAILLLMGISVVGSGTTDFWSLAVVIIKGLALIYFSLIAGKKILPRIFAICAESGELLFLVAIGWCLAFVSLALYSGFSLAIGAFLAGVSLAQSVYRIQISGKIKPLRDFFIMIFFLNLGTGLSISGIGSQLGMAVFILFYITLIKPLVLFFLMAILKYKSHTSFQMGVYMSSLSEFSLIVVVAASKSHLVDPTVVPLVIFATVFSFVFSSLQITHRRAIFGALKSILRKFERKSADSKALSENKLLENHAVLIGCHRSGEIVLKGLESYYGNDLIVVDFNPDIIDELKATSINYLYGDASDPEILESLNLGKADLVVSTIRDLKDNLSLLDYLEKIQSKAVVIVTADDLGQSVKLYERGAHFVSLPTDLEGQNINRLVHDHMSDRKWFKIEREKKLGEVKGRYAKIYRA